MKATSDYKPVLPSTEPGSRIGLWTILGPYGSAPDGHALLLCRCDCGVEKPVYKNNLTRGQSFSCGCRKIRHGHARDNYTTPEYNAWNNMLNHCYNPNHPRFKDWGGRGITVCDRWFNDYPAFLADMGRRPSKHHSLNRKNNDGNYEPENCEWALPKVQLANRRPYKKKQTSS